MNKFHINYYVWFIIDDVNLNFEYTHANMILWKLEFKKFLLLWPTNLFYSKSKFRINFPDIFTWIEHNWLAISKETVYHKHSKFIRIYPWWNPFVVKSKAANLLKMRITIEVVPIIFLKFRVQLFLTAVIKYFLKNETLRMRTANLAKGWYIAVGNYMFKVVLVSLLSTLNIFHTLF